jgi:hypothetical protein
MSEPDVSLPALLAFVQERKEQSDRCVGQWPSAKPAVAWRSEAAMYDALAALLTHYAAVVEALRAVQEFLEVIVVQRGANDHAWLTRCAIDNLAALRALSPPPAADPAKEK